MNIFVFIGVIALVVNGKDLPDYLKKCKLSDADLNVCMRDHANEAIARLAKGDPNFKLINMSPIVIPEVVATSGANLKMTLKEVTTDNLKDVKITKVNFVVNSNKLFFEAALETLEILSKYSMDGKILMFPIKGDGDWNATLVKNMITYDIELGIKYDEGNKYYTIEKAVLEMVPERVYFHFTNLFGGDPALGKQMDEFLNKNWLEFFQELKPALERTVEGIVTNTFSVYFSQVPIDKLFDI